jgi:diguanylate cyclase (GGDEF)-like protein
VIGPTRRTPSALLVLVAVLVAGATVLQLQLVGEAALDRPRLAPLVLAILFAGAEIGVFHVYVRRQAQTFSLMEIPLVLGLLFTSPLNLLGARLLGSAVALVLHRRQPPVKVAFNLALFAFETTVAGVLVRALVGDSDPLGSWGWLAMGATVVVCLVVSSAAIGVVIGIAEGSSPTQLLHRLAGIGTVTSLLAADLGMVVALVLDHDASGGWLLAPGVAVIAFVVAHQGHLQARVELLEQAHQFGSEIAGSLDVEAGDGRLLDRASDLLRAGWAELAYVDEFGEDVVVSTEGGQLEERRGGEARATVLERRQSLGEDEGPVLVPGRTRAADIVVAALPHPSITGTLTVGDRRGTVDSFAEGDLLLVGALAAHAAVALRNRRLLRELQREIEDREHRSLHDSLTGLPNRTLVDIGLDAALAGRREDEVVGVLLIDLNRFKEVNDTLGHHEGDRLLVDVAGRIRAVSPPESLVGRLGGDEFAVVVRGSGDRDVEAAAAAVLDSLAAPFPLANLNVDVGASIGIALSPLHADDGPTLLQRADVAMYAAKASGTGVELYDASVDRNSPERLAIVAELRAAIDAGDIGVEYQPVLDMRTGEVVGAEALARWHHPTRGVVPPNTFVPIAESTGLIASLTKLVLVRALRQAREWRAEGFELGVSVNLSVRDLTDDLPLLIEEQLDLLGLPADALTLEVTESSIMTDPARTIALVHRLSAMGVRISIDDFGTGYSSLSQLHWLPVDEVKIDRSFVEALGSGDAAIVRAVIDLARNLGLRAVAEGVEDGATYQLLRALDCDLVQGWFVCRPKSSTQLLRWLRERRDEAAAVTELGGLETDPART